MRSKFKWILTLLVAFSMQFSFAQEKTITGVVSDGSESLPGVNVVVKGTARGASTSFDGSYSIKAKVGETLVYSFMGMNDISRTVGADNVINVSMQEVPKELVEVVVSGVRRKTSQLPSATKTIKREELTQAGVSNVVQGLIGKVSGLQINTTSNSVNSTTRIVINGTRSITGNNQVLVVIDGAISTAGILQNLPPETVESTTIIKGAQGAALYGEQGANGVVIVTTLKGTGSKEEKLIVSFNSVLDFQQVAYLPQRQTRYGQGWFGDHISIENGSWGAPLDGSLQPSGLPQADGSFITTPYTGDSDNIKKFFNTGTVFQNGISIAGGTIDNGYFNFSANRQDRQFVIKGDELRRTNLLFKAGKKIGKLTVEGNVQYYNTKTSNVANGTGATGTTSLYGQLLQTGTNIPVELFENSGNNGHWTVYTRSPYWTRDNVRQSNSSDQFNVSLNLKYDINKNINISWLGNTQNSGFFASNHTNAFTAKEDIYSTDFGVRLVRSTLAESTQITRNIFSDLLVNFDYELSKDFKLKASIGNNIQDRSSKINNVGGTDLNIPGYYNFQNVLQPTAARNLLNEITRSRRFALFSNVDLSFREFLTLNVTGRNDWSSTLSPENRSFFYPGAGLSFLPLKAFKSLEGSFLSSAKMYASWTKVGNSSAVAAYDIDEVGVIPGGFPFGGLSSFIQNPNPTDVNIKPEFVTTKDFGLSLGFLKDRITFDGQYFISNTTDLITRATASSASGLNSSLLNVGEMETKGYNLDLGLTPIKTGSFTWDVKLNLSHYKSIVTKVSDSADEVNLFTDARANFGIFAVKGEEFPTLKGIGYERDPSGRIIIDGATGVPVLSSEFIKLGKATPDYVLGFTNSFAYKGLRFTVVGDYRTGHQFYSEAREQLAWTGNLIESAENGRSGGFIMPNTVIETSPGVFTPNTNVVTGGNTYASYQAYFSDDQAFNNSENNVLDATALKIREVALSYSVPNKMLARTGLSSITFGVNAKNLFMFLPKNTNNRYYSDPEAANTAGNGQGYANIGQYPFVRSYGFQLNVTF